MQNHHPSQPSIGTVCWGGRFIEEHYDCLNFKFVSIRRRFNDFEGGITTCEQLLKEILVPFDSRRLFSLLMLLEELVRVNRISISRRKGEEKTLSGCKTHPSSLPFN